MSDNIESYLERAKNILNNSTDSEKRIVYSIFPELKREKEDKIKDQLLEFLSELFDSGADIKLNKWLKTDIWEWKNWVKESSQFEPKFKVGDNIQFKGFGHNSYTIKEVCSPSHYISTMGDRMNMSYTDANFEVIKDSNTYKPKFKAGDWVFIEEVEEYKNGPFQIITVDSFGYNFDKYHIIPFMHEYVLSKWTIKDAKDGDVLATDSGNICLFDGTVEEGIYPFAYCGLTSHGFESYDRKLPFTHDYIHPATKEQSDLLFRKLKEAGYEWNAEKKELKNAELKFKVGDYVVDVNFHEGRVYQIMYIDNECYICKYVGKEQLGDKSVRHIAFDYPYLRLTTKPDELTHSEQNSAWSEEDENMVNNIFKAINHLLREHDSWGFLEGCSDWLKSLKDRIHPLQEWSEEDERIRKCLISDQEKALEEVKNDKYGHSEIISDLKEMHRERINWLTTLKERYTWKPSDEQMRALKGVASYNNNDTLKSLYNDLKKLR